MTNTTANPVEHTATRCNRGFTLIEVMFAIIIVGLAIAGLTGSSLAYTRANGTAVDLTTAEYLVEQIHESTAALPVIATIGSDDLVHFVAVGSTGHTFGPPPIDAQGQPINSLSVYSQHVTVQNVSKANFSTVVADNSTNFYRVTVQILKNNSVVCSQSWIRTRY
jgi:prepilin-type N-terminal cleavage/methylation domain-containing protein